MIAIYLNSIISARKPGFHNKGGSRRRGRYKKMKAFAPSSVRLIPALVAGLLAAAPLAHAAGFQLSEQSVAGLGRAHAGAGMVGDDLSAVFYNPAGMTLIEGTQVQGGFTYAEIDAPFEGKGGFPAARQGSDNGRAKAEVIPNAYLVHQLNDRARLGLGITVPFGLGASYDDNWVGRNHGISSSIMTVDFNPSFAYKLDDKWSFGAGVSAQYAKADLKQGAFFPDATGEIDADSWAYGYNLGLMYAFNQDNRVGLSYRSKLHHKARGDYTASGFNRLGIPGFTNVDGVHAGAADVTTPESLLLSGFSRLNSKWALSATARWTNWSRFDQLVIKGNPKAETVIDNNWKASWLFSVGADYNYNDQLTLRSGVGYETSPVRNSSYRNPLIPDTDRVWLSLGASYKASKQLTVDAGYTYLMGVGDREINHTAKSPLGNGDTLQGSYSSIRGHLLGVQMQYKF